MPFACWDWEFRELGWAPLSCCVFTKPFKSLALPGKTSSRCRMKIGELVPVDVKLLLPPSLTNRPCSEFLPHKLAVATTQHLELTCSFFILHILRCFKELEPWRTPSTSRPIKKVGVELMEVVGGYFYTAFLSACRRTCAFLVALSLFLFLIIQGETSKVGHMVTKDKTGVLHIFMMHKMTQIAALSMIKKQNVWISVQIWPETKFWLWASKCPTKDGC